MSYVLSKDFVIRPEGQSNAHPVLGVDAATGQLTLSARSIIVVIGAQFGWR